MDKTFERSFLNALIILDKEGCKLARTGICGNVPEIDKCITMLETVDKVSQIVQDWPHFSGDCHYPVEGSALQYNRHVNKWTPPYGNLRKDLLKYLIKTLEKRIGSVNE